MDMNDVDTIITIECVVLAAVLIVAMWLRPL